MRDTDRLRVAGPVVWQTQLHQPRKKKITSCAARPVARHSYGDDIRSPDAALHNPTPPCIRDTTGACRPRFPLSALSTATEVHLRLHSQRDIGSERRSERRLAPEHGDIGNLR